MNSLFIIPLISGLLGTISFLILVFKSPKIVNKVIFSLALLSYLFVVAAPVLNQIWSYPLYLIMKAGRYFYVLGGEYGGPNNFDIGFMMIVAATYSLVGLISFIFALLYLKVRRISILLIPYILALFCVSVVIFLVIVKNSHLEDRMKINQGNSVTARFAYNEIRKKFTKNEIEGFHLYQISALGSVSRFGTSESWFIRFCKTDKYGGFIKYDGKWWSDGRFTEVDNEPFIFNKDFTEKNNMICRGVGEIWMDSDEAMEILVKNNTDIQNGGIADSLTLSWNEPLGFSVWSNRYETTVISARTGKIYNKKRY